MSSDTTYVILGAGQAGGRAAETLREEGFMGRIVLVGAEEERPYERPPLSKGFLLGSTARERLFLQPAPFYAERQVDLLLGTTALAVRPSEHLVDLADGTQLRYDRLLIATGVRPRVLPIAGMDLAGVHVLRTLRDAELLGTALASAPRVAIVGAGFIGAEIAAACRMRGLAVTMLEALPAPLYAALDTDIADLYAQIHRDEGVDLRLNSTVKALHGAGQVSAVEVQSGELIPCDVVVVGIGSVPNTAFLEDSGLLLNDGVVCDQYCCTTAPDIFAAGDVARWYHPVLAQPLRLEHWDNAEQQGRAAARAMLGIRAPYAPVPYFWSDQYQYALQYIGHHQADDQRVLRGSLEQRAFTAFYLRHGVPMAAVILNRPRDGTIARRLIAAGRMVDPTLLADEGTDLRTLLPRG